MLLFFTVFFNGGLCKRNSLSLSLSLSIYLSLAVSFSVLVNGKHINAVMGDCVRWLTEHGQCTGREKLQQNSQQQHQQQQQQRIWQPN